VAATNPLSALSAEKDGGLQFWMEKVVERSEHVRKEWSSDSVHDLRVALRRCRTMADALHQIEPGPGWRKVKKASRELFDSLGDLRDAQVERGWVKQLTPSGDMIRRYMLGVLSRLEHKRQAEASRALDRFDEKSWRKLTRKLESKAAQFPLESIVFQRLALERLDEAVELCQRARKGRSRVAWHRLRIGVKRFRYIVENFLPQRYQEWAPELKRMQDLLGEVHDLDVLRVEVRRRSTAFEETAVADWLKKIENERNGRLEEFRARVSDRISPWQVWRGGLPFVSTPRSTPPPQRAAAASAG